MKHNLAVYVVVTTENLSEAPDNVTALCDRMVSNWKRNKEFPIDNYFVVVWMLPVTHYSTGEVAVVAGPHLTRLGVTDEQMQRIRMGSKGMEPQGAVVFALAHLNREIERAQGKGR